MWSIYRIHPEKYFRFKVTYPDCRVCVRSSMKGLILFVGTIIQSERTSTVNTSLCLHFRGLGTVIHWLLFDFPLLVIWKGNCIPFPSKTANCISQVLVCDWQSLYLPTTLHQIFEKIFPLLNNRQFVGESSLSSSIINDLWFVILRPDLTCVFLESPDLRPDLTGSFVRPLTLPPVRSGPGLRSRSRVGTSV
jgi:hypothetical protein